VPHCAFLCSTIATAVPAIQFSINSQLTESDTCDFGILRDFAAARRVALTRCPVSRRFRSRRTRHLVDAAHRLVELVALEHVGFESGRGLEPAVRLDHVEQPEPRPGAVENLIALEARAAADDRDPVPGRACDEVARIWA